MLQVRFTMSGTRTGRVEEETKSCKGRGIDLSPTDAEELSGPVKSATASWRWPREGTRITGSSFRPSRVPRPTRRTYTTGVSSPS